MNNTAKALVFVGLAAFGSWLFGLWTQAALAPGLSAWWSMLLLILGTVVFWSLLRPDRKALNLVTMGQMHGHSRTLRRLAMAAGGAYVMGKVKAAASATKAGAAAQRAALRDEMRPDPEGAATARAWRLGHASAADPYSLPDQPEVDPYRLTGTTRVGGPEPVRSSATTPVYVPPKYQQPTAAGVPTPPPAGATGSEDIYEVKPTDWWTRT